MSGFPKSSALTKTVIQEQIAYYRARANEYDEWFYRIGRYDRGEEINQCWFREVAVITRELHQIGAVKHILELACGTGIWTQKLLSLGEKITAIDTSTEMIAINRSKLGSPRVDYRQVDLFSWKPDKEYDLVFFSFWLSHVPPTLLDSFLTKVYNSVRIGGQIFIIDSRFSPTSTAKNHTLIEDSNIHKIRKLNDGREFKIIKIFYEPNVLKDKLIKVGFKADVKVTENYFLYTNGIKMVSMEE